MLRGLEVADQVVMLERRSGQQQRVQHRAEQGETPDPTIQTPSHHFDDTPGGEKRKFEDLRFRISGFQDLRI